MQLADLAFINIHTKTDVDGALEVVMTQDKGRLLRACRAFHQGEVILADAPLNIVKEDGSSMFRKILSMCLKCPETFIHEPIWYFCVVKSLTSAQLNGAHDGEWEPITQFTQDLILLLQHDIYADECTPSDAAEAICVDLISSVPPLLIDQLLNVWILNGFLFSEEPAENSLHFLASFASHSCIPNAFFCFEGNTVVFRARVDVVPGDDVCISYVSDSCLMRSGYERRWELHETKGFWCNCIRCTGGDDLSRGFVCMKCKKGHVFAPSPGREYQVGPSPPLTGIQGVICNLCKHVVVKGEAEMHFNDETMLAFLIKKFSSTPNKVLAHEIETLISRAFGPHWLVDSAGTDLEKYYSREHWWPDQLRVLHRRCMFQCRAFPCLCSSHAFALEAYADVLQSRFGSRNKCLDEACRVYDEVLCILLVLYGREHAYFQRLLRKRRDLEKLMANGGKGENDVSLIAAE